MSGKIRVGGGLSSERLFNDRFTPGQAKCSPACRKILRPVIAMHAMIQDCAPVCMTRPRGSIVTGGISVQHRLLVVSTKVCRLCISYLLFHETMSRSYVIRICWATALMALFCVCWHSEVGIFLSPN
jgi:hypothetical protein